MLTLDTSKAIYILFVTVFQILIMFQPKPTVFTNFHYRNTFVSSYLVVKNEKIKSYFRKEFFFTLFVENEF